MSYTQNSLRNFGRPVFNCIFIIYILNMKQKQTYILVSIHDVILNFVEFNLNMVAAGAAEAISCRSQISNVDFIITFYHKILITKAMT